MRYEFVGKKTSHVGKTLWEIVGNLKNFGVGRLVKRSSTIEFPELSFIRIIKVQAISPPKKEFENRNVIVWIEEVFRDRKKGVKYTLDGNNECKFQLIPKLEEDKYLKALEKLEPPKKYLMKYCYWPPLYKKMWEKNASDTKYESIPKMKYLSEDNTGYEVIEVEEETKPATCSLYKGELSVDEMYKEIVRLKLLIKANAQA